ncbi:hypothetical protein GCM10009838_15710 [Catenulispora subtropica]|uniref:Transcriptional regulator, SARP family n=1 Tax=Catenulispora subtropica TaxID=450798 RepID=A0ABN2QYN6_9ACTN
MSGQAGAVVIDIALLGTVKIAVRSGEGATDVALSYLERSLLAALACAPGTVVSTERLADMLWDGPPPSGARTRVHGLVSSVRKRVAAAGGDALVLATDPSGYVLCVEPERVDAECFRALMLQASDAVERGERDSATECWQRALGLWRGPAFDGLRPHAFQIEALALEEMRMTAWENCFDADLRSGRYERVIPELTRQRARHPGRERLVAQLMIALHATDRHAEALGTYRALRQHLRDEYGMSPGVRVSKIHELLLRGPSEMGELLATLPGCHALTG